MRFKKDRNPGGCILVDGLLFLKGFPFLGGVIKPSIEGLRCPERIAERASHPLRKNLERVGIP